MGAPEQQGYGAGEVDQQSGSRHEDSPRTGFLLSRWSPQPYRNTADGAGERQQVAHFDTGQGPANIELYSDPPDHFCRFGQEQDRQRPIAVVENGEELAEWFHGGLRGMAGLSVPMREYDLVNATDL